MTDQSDIPPHGHDPRKRERLLEAAAEDFARVGFDRANLDAIARKAGVAKGTVYLYFPSKAALFAAVLDELRGRLEAKLVATESSGGDPMATLRLVIRAHLSLADTAPDFFRCYTSALFGVNREFQGAALSIFSWQTSLIERLLAPGHGRSTRARKRTTLLAGSILSAALVRGLMGREGTSTAFEEDALMAMVSAA
jgi:AcrR family transcriptional regulator